jgi:hypothetical protein
MNTFDHLDYYQILGVNQNDSTTRIREAYLRVSKMTHPDNSDGLANATWFAAATRARDTLVNRESRRAYDAWLVIGTSSPPSTSPPSPSDNESPFSHSADRSRQSRYSEDRYVTYLRSRSWLLFFLGSVVLYLDWIHPIPAPHEFLRNASLISWVVFWIVPKKVVSWLIKLPRRHHESF